MTPAEIVAEYEAALIAVRQWTTQLLSSPPDSAERREARQRLPAAEIRLIEAESLCETNGGTRPERRT